MHKRLITLALLLAVAGLLVSLPAGIARADEQIIAPGDMLSVTVLGEPDLTKKVIVDIQGKITLPLAGEIEVGGVTPTEASARLRNSLTKYVKNPQVTIEVAEAAKRMVVISGAVKTPGVYQIDGSTTLMAGLTLAGGYTPEADLSKVTVTRGPKKDNVMNIDLTQFMSGANPEQNIALQANDTVVVPERNPIAGQVYVLGEVNQRGAFPMRAGMTFREAVAAAGGITQLADVTKVTIKHENQTDGTVVDFPKASAGDPNANFALLSGDSIYVPAMETNGNFTIIGPVARPGQYPLRGNMYITDAIATAGGTTEIGNLSNVTVTHVSGGKSRTVKVNVPKISDGKTENVALEPGDQILVGTRKPPVDKVRLGGLLASLLFLLKP
jgi:protein involved in polysaccharide export with SLBB domain